MKFLLEAFGKVDAQPAWEQHPALTVHESHCLCKDGKAHTICVADIHAYVLKPHVVQGPFMELVRHQHLNRCIARQQHISDCILEAAHDRGFEERGVMNADDLQAALAK